MATKTVLDFGAITSVLGTDIMYLIRGTGTTRDKQITLTEFFNTIPAATILGNLTVDSPTLFVDSSTHRIGFNTIVPQTTVELKDGIFSFSDADVAHGITALNLTTNIYGLVQINDGTGGGLDITGASDSAGISGLTMRGIIGVTDPTDTVPALSLIGGKANGTGWQALGAAETVFQVSNYTTTLMTVLGDGKVGIGTTSPDNAFHIMKASAGTVASQASANLTIESDTHNYLQFLTPAGYLNAIVFGDADDNDIGGIYYNHSNNSLGFNTNTTTKLSISSAGAIDIASGGVIQHNGITVMDAGRNFTVNKITTISASGVSFGIGATINVTAGPGIFLVGATTGTSNICRGYAMVRTSLAVEYIGTPYQMTITISGNDIIFTNTSGVSTSLDYTILRLF